MVGKRSKQLPSFWIPELQPSAKERIMEKPDQKVYCPLSGKQLKLKDLIPIIFTQIKDDDEKRNVAKKVRYMCPVTHDALTNTTPCAVLRTSGHVVTEECVENIVKKDWTDPTNGKSLTEADIIALQRGGTGFAATNERLDAKLHRPAAVLI